MSTWKATEGLRRAILVVQQIETELVAEIGIDIVKRSPLADVVRWRVTQIIAQELDQALGATAWPQMPAEKNGHAEPWWKAEAAMDEKAVTPNATGPVVRAWDPVLIVPATADPVGAELPPESDYSGVTDWGYPSVTLQEAAPEQAAKLFEAPKKRGRPKGSTNKAKKKAKAAKAKAVAAPVVEAEAPAEDHPNG